MGAKLWAQEPKVLKYTYDFSLLGGAVGAISLGNLPDGFIVEKMTREIVTALTSGGAATVVLGEDGGGDADGYATDFFADAAGSVGGCQGALIWTAPATANEIGAPKPHKVAAAKDGLTLTVGTAALTAGKFHVYVMGHQSLA
jgi:hypothetical protein